MNMNPSDRIVELLHSDGDEIVSVQEMDFDVCEDNKPNLEYENIDDDEDVPANFFDDFESNDFMDGLELDVLDAWDNENEHKENKTPVKSQKSTRTEKFSRRHSHSRSSSRQKYRDDYYNRKNQKTREKSRDKKTAHKSRGKKSKEKLSESLKTAKRDNQPDSKEPGEFEEVPVDHRRDPQKTKRDIQKDKDKCAKHQEEKFISEKLKVVETGLVPPGTEMDIDIKSLKSTVVVKEPSKPRSLHTDKRRSRSTGRSTNRRNVSPRNFDRRRLHKHSRSPYRRRSRSRSSTRWSRSPRRRGGKESLEHRTYPDRRSNRYKGPSPEKYQRSSRNHSLDLSPKSNASERELWLRNREKQSAQGSSRSKRSSSRHRGRDFLEELASKFAKSEKKNYYKHMQEIVSESSKKMGSYHMMPSLPAPVPVPAPAPISVPMIAPPQYFPQQIDPAPQYDQQFFIGQQFPNNVIQYHPTPFMGGPSDCPMSNHNILEPQICGPNHQVLNENICATSVMNTTESNLNMSNNIKIEVQKEKEAINKLFEDKKISLSDFLSMSAKHGDYSEPINIQKKIMVISLCQDALKSLGGASNLTGRCFLRKSQKEIERPQEGKFQSPLRKIPVVRFSFTIPSKGGEDKSKLQSTLSKILSSLGLMKVTPAIMPPPSPNSVLMESPIQSIKPLPSKWLQMSTSDSPTKISLRKAKMCQTDPLKCQVCEIRKARTFTNVEVQCEISSVVDSGTQITDEDLIRMGIKLPFKDNLKNQSLAHLTPAQLMRQTLVQEDNLQHNTYSSIRNPSDISPEKHNFRAGDNFNRTEFVDKFLFDSFGNSNRTGLMYNNPSSSNFENRSLNTFDNTRLHSFDNRHNTNLMNPSKDKNTRGTDFFESGRNNYGNNPNPPPLMQTKRPLLPNPFVGRKF